jgi:hypothetical protein
MKDDTDADRADSILGEYGKLHTRQSGRRIETRVSEHCRHIDCINRERLPTTIQSAEVPAAMQSDPAHFNTEERDGMFLQYVGIRLHFKNNTGLAGTQTIYFPTAQNFKPYKFC